MSSLEAATDHDRMRTLGKLFAELERDRPALPRVSGRRRADAAEARELAAAETDAEMARPSTRRRERPRSERERAPRAARGAAGAEGSERGQGPDRRDPSGRRRTGGGSVGRGPVRDVPAARGTAQVEDRGAGLSPSELGGYKEVVARDPRTDAYGRLKHESGVHRVQRVPVDRVPGQDPHVDGDGRGDARGRGGRGRDPARGSRDRRLPIERARRTVGEHDRLGGADRAQAHRHQGRDAGGAFPAAEPGEGDALPARTSVPEGARRAAGEGGRGAPIDGRHRANAPRRSAPTTSRRDGSPTIASSTPPISSPTCSRAGTSWTGSPNG